MCAFMRNSVWSGLPGVNVDRAVEAARAISDGQGWTKVSKSPLTWPGHWLSSSMKYSGRMQILRVSEREPAGMR